MTVTYSRWTEKFIIDVGKVSSPRYQPAKRPKKWSTVSARMTVRSDHRRRPFGEGTDQSATASHQRAFPSDTNVTIGLSRPPALWPW